MNEASKLIICNFVCLIVLVYLLKCIDLVNRTFFEQLYAKFLNFNKLINNLYSVDSVFIRLAQQGDPICTPGVTGLILAQGIISL